MDGWTELFKEYLLEDNMSSSSYYEIQKLVYILGCLRDERCLHQELHYILERR